MFRKLALSSAHSVLCLIETFYNYNCTKTCLALRLQKLQESSAFLSFLMKCMDTLLLGVTDLFQWEFSDRVSQLLLLDLCQRDGWFLVGDWVGLL